MDKSCRVEVCCSCHVVSRSGLVCCTVRCCNRNKHLVSGLTAFDFISDFEEWIDCGYFSEEIKARLKGSVVYKVFFENNVAKKTNLLVPAYSLQSETRQRSGASHNKKGQRSSTFNVTCSNEEPPVCFASLRTSANDVAAHYQGKSEVGSLGRA